MSVCLQALNTFSRRDLDAAAVSGVERDLNRSHPVWSFLSDYTLNIGACILILEPFYDTITYTCVLGIFRQDTSLLFVKMETVEMNTACTEGHQKEKMLPPSEEDFPPVSKETSDTLNFSDLTPSQFGISVQSFTPALSNRKDKSRLAQIKARRRSSIGVRGSPETNSLIRFMAQQKMTPSTFQTPELVKSSPFLPRVASTLRQKMASFQSLMDVEESEGCDPMPRRDSNTGGCIKTRDYLSDEYSLYGGKENHPPTTTTPVPSKRRRLGPLEGCEVEIREPSAPTLHSCLKELEEEEEPVTQVVKQPLPSCATVEEVQAVLISPTLSDDFELQCRSPAKNQQDGVFELQSLCRPPPDVPAAASPAQPASSFHIPSLPSLLEMKPTGEDVSSGTSTVKKKKRVRFGGPLSPEFFDKNLPPSTPLQKGATPARAPTPGGGLQPRSVLKTPQRSESQTPISKPDLSSPTEFGASPTLAMPRNPRVQSVGEDGEENDGKIVFPSMDEIDSALTRDKECMWDTKPLNLNSAFHEEFLSQILTASSEFSSESETNTSTASQMDERTSMVDMEKEHEAGVEPPAPAPTRNRRKKQPGPEHESTSEAPARSGSRKRKQPEESEPVKRSARSAAKSASGKMKMSSTAARRWNRDVDRSLYGSRAYASKNPTLSPITERLSLIGQSPAAPQTPSTSCTAPNHETHMNPKMANNPEAIGDLTLTNSLENPSEDSVTSPSRESTPDKGRKLSGQRGRGRSRKQRKVSVADDILLRQTLDQTGGKAEQHCEDHTTTSLEASGETPLNITVSEQVDTEHDVQTAAETHCTGKLECPTSGCPPSAEESYNILPAEPAQRKAKRGRRSSVHSSVLQEHQTSHEVEEKGQREQAAGQQENDIRSGSDGQEASRGAVSDLAPWQADFNFEDVFKPVSTRGQRSVRRSLRNQSNADSAGLAWLPLTSPEAGKEARRRTRGRRLSAAPPVQLPEETQDNAS
ncbi:cell division cycle-associated protein 2 isoform X3 [Centropristis striata]|uniref:cell division cycle-associated protein 2 isoform X3 n=1 Tax=Centropristis striata TaxID=184440 RepID=UPI0027DF256E|nr:cell division cycle-associated protein 2 isoform X3 [Centropristis striata]